MGDVIRFVASMSAVLALVIAGVGLAARYLPITSHPVLYAAVASPYLLLAAPLGALLFAVARRWLGACVAAVVTVAAVAVQAPLFVGDTVSSDGVHVRVMTANLFLGQADATAVVATATAKADVLVVEELTPEEVNRLKAAGLDRNFAFQALDARESANGGGIWSRYPITASRRIDNYELAMVSARVRIAGVAVDPTVLVAHMPGPWPQPIDDWVRDLEAMRGTLRTASNDAGSGCVMVAGDFNSTFEMRPFRRLLGEGYRDATEQAGAGFKLTYPGNSFVPPFMGIDHVLTARCTAISTETVSLPGSDHRGLVATVVVPRQPAS
jgi:endonuclease/exonuclease/phosphatase (EEP) superfamily protein YafD